MGVVVHTHDPAGDLEERLRQFRIDRHIAERSAKRARLPEGDSSFDFAHTGMVGRKDDDETGNGYAREGFRGGTAGIDVAGMWDDDGPSSDGIYASVGEQSRDCRSQFHGISGIEPSADCGGPDHYPEEETPGQR